MSEFKSGFFMAGEGCNGRVLVVDDEPDIRKVVKMTLQKAGYDVLEAEHGEKGQHTAVAGAVPSDGICHGRKEWSGRSGTTRWEGNTKSGRRELTGPLPSRSAQPLFHDARSYREHYRVIEGLLRASW